MVYILLAVFFQTASLTAGKYAAIGYTGIHRYLSYEYILSLSFLFLQAIIWQQALKKKPLSFAYPFMSLVLVLVLIVSLFIFHESVTYSEVIGSGFIIAGVIIVTSGHRT